MKIKQVKCRIEVILRKVPYNFNKIIYKVHFKQINFSFKI